MQEASVVLQIGVIFGGAAILIILIMAKSLFKLFTIYVTAKASNAECPYLKLVGMRLRKLDPGFIVENMKILRNGGIDATYDECENHVMAGGQLSDVVDAMISAHKAGLDIDFKKVCSIDLAGRDILQAINSCVEPITIDIPPNKSKQKYIMGIAKDGIRVGVRVKVTAKADIHKLIGGAGKRTIIARVGEGIVSTIGKCDNHKIILETPDIISSTILSRSLDANTAFSIISVDIGNIEVIDNIGAQLSQDQANADQLVAQANSEARKAMAAAANRENTARLIEMTTLEILNRAEIPKDLSKAYQRGNIFRSPKPVYSVVNRKLWEAN